MTDKIDEPLVVFWCWQDDSPRRTNRNFIEDCLDRAVKTVGRDTKYVISVDRDTKSVGGMPNIAETILAKIRSCDVFVWDATLAYSDPRAAPNPNVALELGYALAVLGEGRLIGVLNQSVGPDASNMPFDFQNRRWPIVYQLPDEPKWRRYLSVPFPRFKGWFAAKRNAQRETLVDSLAKAIKAALAEPKRGALLADVDLFAAKSLWKVIDSQWMKDWNEAQDGYPQFFEDRFAAGFDTYMREVDKPEKKFVDIDLKTAHNEFVTQIVNFLALCATEMVPHPSSTGRYLLIAKANEIEYDMVDDSRYNRQLHEVGISRDQLWKAWEKYVEELRRRYPEVTNP